MQKQDEISKQYVRNRMWRRKIRLHSSLYIKNTVCTYHNLRNRRCLYMFWPTYCRARGRLCWVSHTPQGSRYLGMLYLSDHWEAFRRQEYFTNISTKWICSSRSSATTYYTYTTINLLHTRHSAIQI